MSKTDQETNRILRLLGPVTVEQSPPSSTNQETTGEQVPRFRSRRTIALLGYLVASRHAVSRDSLAAMFWPDKERSEGRAALRRELYNLDRVLPDCWQVDRQEVTFSPPANTKVDLYQLQEFTRQERWREAADLVGGEFLEGLQIDNNPEFELWLLNERGRWKSRSEAVLTHLIEAHIRRGQYTEALQQSRRLLQLAPSNETIHQQVMRLLAWTGQRQAALRQFDLCREALRQDLEVEPSPETVTLYQRIQSGDLEPPSQQPAFLTDAKPRHPFKRTPFVGRETELGRLNSYLEEALAGRARMSFITGGPGSGKSALLEAFSLESMESHSDLLVARGDCNAYSGMSDPFLPFREMMAMLTGEVESLWDAGGITQDHAQRLWAGFPDVVSSLLEQGPQLIDALVPGDPLLARATTIESDETSWLPHLQVLVNRQNPPALEQSYLFQQMTRVLQSIAATQPLLLILDDLQWADHASISLLFHLGRTLADTEGEILILCAYRPEEVTADPAQASPDQGERHPISGVLNELKRIYGDVWLELTEPDEEAGRRFIDLLLDTEPNQLTEKFRAALYDRTRGHPLFTVELLRSMQDRGDLTTDEQGRWQSGGDLDWSLFPARVEAVLQQRINRLPIHLQEILKVACIEGETFTAEVVAHSIDASAGSVLRQLSQDLERRHRLIKEEEQIFIRSQTLSRFRFSHALYAEYLQNSLGRAERKRWHGVVGEVLEELFEGNLKRIAIQLATHFHAAGDLDRAFKYYKMAAERAARLFAEEEVVTHYTHAIELAEIVSPGALEVASLHRGRGLVLERLGRFEQARTDHRTALQLARSAQDNRNEWQALIALGRLWAYRDYARTRQYFQQALTIAREMGDPNLLASSLNWMGNWHTNAENPRRAAEFHREALAIADKLDDNRELANTLDLLGVAKLMEGDLAACAKYYNRAIPLFRQLDDRPRLVSCLTGRAGTFSALAFLSSAPASPAPEACADIQEALDLADEIGALPGKAWALWVQGMQKIVRGRFRESLDAFQEGVQLSSEIDHREYEVANRFGLGRLYLELLEPMRAREQLEQALPISAELRSSAMSHLTSGVLAATHLMARDFTAVEKILAEAIPESSAMDTMGKRYCWVQRAKLALVEGNPKQALEIVERLISSAPGRSDGRVITYLWKLKAEALACTGSPDQAIGLLQEAVRNTEASGEHFLKWRLHACLGRTHQILEQAEQAEQFMAIAQAHLEDMADLSPHLENEESLLLRAQPWLNLETGVLPGNLA